MFREDGGGDEVPQILDRQRLARHQHHGLLGEQDDRSKVGRGVVERTFEQCLTESLRGDGADEQMVPIGSAARHAAGADLAARTDDIFNNHRLPQ